MKIIVVLFIVLLISSCSVFKKRDIAGVYEESVDFIRHSFFRKLEIKNNNKFILKESSTINRPSHIKSGRYEIFGDTLFLIPKNTIEYEHRTNHYKKFRHKCLSSYEYPCNRDTFLIRKDGLYKNSFVDSLNKKQEFISFKKVEN